MAEYTDIPINGTPARPKVLELDAEIVAGIIVRVTRIKPDVAISAANEVMDYLIAALSQVSDVQ